MRLRRTIGSSGDSCGFAEPSARGEIRAAPIDRLEGSIVMEVVVNQFRRILVGAE